jgi:hypothetical protein
MSRSPALARAIRSSGRWLLPWMSVLLVSASLVFAISTTLNGSRTTRDGQRQQTAFTFVVASVPPADAAPEGSDGRVLGRSCASLFGSYNGWLFSSGGHGPCGLEPDATTPAPDQLSRATAALADGDDVRTRLPVGRPELASLLVSRSDP